ncbi:NCS2 family permease [Halomarina oriensis]|uniref:NCS2 family permease n=1 Tax=Halomarina oriensis TaxID=671145 RepID=A0A6B0GT38_9EURY|nr:NCS2 family permease [Halomarina oriensis]MWG34868.1 NCS2 family permease [Halomarina oriensis]
MGPADTQTDESSNESGGVRGFFEFDRYGTDLGTEVTAGVTTFLTMSYIVFLNPAILGPAITVPGMSDGAVRSMLAVVTILSAVVATTVMALYANRPFGQAPGLGLNAFFAFTVVLGLGVAWQTALAAVVVEGVVFVLLTAVGARKFIIEAFPEPVKFSVGAGIGAFLALIGLEEMGIVVNDDTTLVTLGNVASDPIAIVSIVGLFLTLALYARGIRGSIVIGILGTTVLGSLVTMAGLVSTGTVAPSFVVPLRLGLDPLVVSGGFDWAALQSQLFGAQYDISPLAGAFVTGLSGVEPFSFALIVFTFFFVDFFDTAGTLTGVGQAAGFLDEDGDLPEIEKPLMADAVGTTVGGMLGTSTVTTFIESATGVEEGGRTGMTALVVALLFLVSLAFVPLATAIPLYASHIALVVIAVVMLGNIAAVDWDDITHAVPAGLTILVMPFTFNIGYGIAAGIVSYPLVKVAVGEWEDVRPTQVALALAFVVYFVVATGGVLDAAVGS